MMRRGAIPASRVATILPSNLAAVGVINSDSSTGTAEQQQREASSSSQRGKRSREDNNEALRTHPIGSGPPQQKEQQKFNTIGVWYRNKDLRMKDFEPLRRAAADASSHIIPFFILSADEYDPNYVGLNRFRFMIDAIEDLDAKFRRDYGSRLFVIQPPKNSKKFNHPALPAFEQKCFRANSTSLLDLTDAIYYQYDSDKASRDRDAEVDGYLAKKGITSQKFHAGHTILDIEKVISDQDFKAPIAMTQTERIMATYLPVVRNSVVIPPVQPAPTSIPPLPSKVFTTKELLPPADVTEYFSAGKNKFISERSSDLWPGGETAGLALLKKTITERPAWIAKFAKPNTRSTNDPSDPEKPDTSGLSPYIRYGCVSIRDVWHETSKAMAGRSSTKPPVSMHGQLLFREQFYILSRCVDKFDQVKGNRMCRPVNWDKDKKKLEAWEKGQTGYPLIDALMRQLNETGWMHHLGRHAVSCFLTRGDLYQSWTDGRAVFDRLLLDSDWALNNANWLWLSGVAPFSMPYFRIYDPIPKGPSSINAFPGGASFIRRFIPELENMPEKYLTSPWEAPLAVQKEAGCIIGTDYPKPIVDHKTAREKNLAKLKADWATTTHGGYK